MVRCISALIDSALNQTCPYKEVVVIDDGSTDASLSVIIGYGDQIRWESGPRSNTRAIVGL